MALNTRFGTAIHVLVLLGAEPDRLHTSEDVARILKTNSVVVRRIFLQLQSAALTRSYKGPGGGAKLARPPKRITLRDIYRAVHPQGLLPPPSPVMPNLQSALKSVFKDTTRAFEAELDQTTLARLLKKSMKQAQS